jgi:hypothetical protein
VKIAEVEAFRLLKFVDKADRQPIEAQDLKETVLKLETAVAPVHDEHFSVHFPGLLGFMKFK